ncbi:MAG: homocysteine S-methyltransferase family protein [Opitutaceae bacterium]|nr:homocysteine S-methyltransferase family protein [Opitutaceae bacterium]
MADFLTTLKAQPLLTDGAMGSYLFSLTGRLSETNHVYEAFNTDQPDLIRKVHHAYLAAGARCLKTNTFGANRRQLRQFGLQDRVTAINRAGVQVAREAIAAFKAENRVPGPFFVLASVGPTAEPLTTAYDVAECYHEQIDALIAAGADALLLETFGSLTQLELLISLIQARPGTPPVIAEMTLRAADKEHALEPDPVTFINRMAALGVAVAGVNCCAPWDASAFVDAVADAEPVRAGALQLVVMPNAGGFQRIGNRFMTSVNPESAGKLVRSLADRGVRLLGGCCEMHPPHIEEMQNYLQTRGGARITAAAGGPVLGAAAGRRHAKRRQRPALAKAQGRRICRQHRGGAAARDGGRDHPAQGGLRGEARGERAGGRGGFHRRLARHPAHSAGRLHPPRARAPRLDRGHGRPDRAHPAFHRP